MEELYPTEKDSTRIIKLFAEAIIGLVILAIILIILMLAMVEHQYPI